MAKRQKAEKAEKAKGTVRSAFRGISAAHAERVCLDIARVKPRTGLYAHRPSRHDGGARVAVEGVSERLGLIVARAYSAAQLSDGASTPTDPAHLVGNQKALAADLGIGESELSRFLKGKWSGSKRINGLSLGYRVLEYLLLGVEPKEASEEQKAVAERFLQYFFGKHWDPNDEEPPVPRYLNGRRKLSSNAWSTREMGDEIHGVWRRQEICNASDCLIAVAGAGYLAMRETSDPNDPTRGPIRNAVSEAIWQGVEVELVFPEGSDAERDAFAFIDEIRAGWDGGQPMTGNQEKPRIRLVSVAEGSSIVEARLHGFLNPIHEFIRLRANVPTAERVSSTDSLYLVRSLLDAEQMDEFGLTVEQTPGEMARFDAWLDQVRPLGKPAEFGSRKVSSAGPDISPAVPQGDVRSSRKLQLGHDSEQVG